MSQSETIKCLLKDAWHVAFTDLPEEYEGTTIVWGTVEIDYTGDYEKGFWCCTSPVRHIEDDMVTTQNSLYQILGALKPISLPLKCSPILREGFDPVTCIELLSGRMSIQVDW